MTLKIRVHIISLSDKFAFTKTKRNYPFEIPNAAKYMINFNTEKPELNTDPARIDSSMIHEMVISYFGTNAKTMFDIVSPRNSPLPKLEFLGEKRSFYSAVVI